MKRTIEVVILASAMLLLPIIVVAQGRAPQQDNTSRNISDCVEEDLQKQLRVLRDRTVILETRLHTLSPASPDYALTRDWIRELAELIESLRIRGSNGLDETTSTQSGPIAVSQIAVIPTVSSVAESVTIPTQTFQEPAFKLS